MHIIVTKGERGDRIEARRADGSAVGFDLPKKGPVPHDVTHLLVERQFGIERGFWGMVAGGADPAEIGAMAKAAGHASAKRASPPDPSFVPIIQTERLVEAFEADMWSGGGDADSIRAMAASGCEQSHVPPLAVDDAGIDAVRAAMTQFGKRWADLGVGETEELRWESPAAS